MLEEEDSSADFGTIAAATAVVGVVGATAYHVGTEVALNQLLPAGTSVPQDRAQLALLLWNTAGRPEPAALPAFADVTATDTAKAAQWCMEAGFFQPREDGNFKPGKHVSRWKVLRTYQRIVKYPLRHRAQARMTDRLKKGRAPVHHARGLRLFHVKQTFA